MQKIAKWLGLSCLLAALTLTAAGQTATPELNITFGEQRLKFAPARTFQEMRLSVFNSQGELVYGASTAEAELSWPIKTNNGEALAPGLYRYVLALKYGDNDERLHQGHFIIEQGRTNSGSRPVTAPKSAAAI
jgi:hypothetical protein